MFYLTYISFPLLLHTTTPANGLVIAWLFMFCPTFFLARKIVKPFGIAALVLSFIAVITPLVGVYIAGLAGILAFFSAGGGTTFGVSAVIINIVNILFLSPSLIMTASDEFAINASHQDQSQINFTILLLIQLIAITVFVVKWFISKRTSL